MKNLTLPAFAVLASAIGVHLVAPAGAFAKTGCNDYTPPGGTNWRQGSVELGSLEEPGAHQSRQVRERGARRGE